MTCAHVLGLIDAGLRPGYPPSHVAAAWSHAETCPECGPAMAAAERLVRDLGDWPDVAAPVDVAAVVMARIAQVDEARATDARESPAAPDGLEPVPVGDGARRPGGLRRLGVVGRRWRRRR